MAEIANPAGWKTRTASVLVGVHALIGMVIYFVAGGEAEGAVAPMVGMLQMLAGFGLWAWRDAITKVIGSIGGK